MKQNDDLGKQGQPVYLDRTVPAHAAQQWQRAE
jgi:hypothetical protein